MQIQHYYQAIKKSPVGYAYHRIICDSQGVPVDYEFLDVNTAFESMTGLDATAVLGKKVTDVIPGIQAADFDWITYYGRIALQGGEEEIEQYSADLKRWYKVFTYSPEKNCFITLFTDITKEKEELAALDQFFSVNLDLLCIADLNGNFVKVNPEWENVLGYKKEDLESRSFLDFVHPEDMQPTLDALSRLKTQESVFNFRNRYRCRDGSYKHIEWRSRPVGHLVYAAARDITDKVHERNEMAAIVRSSESFLEQKNICYQRVADELLALSGAKFATFNLYAEDGKSFHTVAIAGPSEVISDALPFLPFSVVGKSWLHDTVRAEKIKNATVTRFPSLGELAGYVIPQPITMLIERTLHVGETVVIKITENDRMLGDVTLFRGCPTPQNLA